MKEYPLPPLPTYSQTVHSMARESRKEQATEVRAFATLVSLFGYLASEIRPQPCDTKVVKVPPDTWYFRTLKEDEQRKVAIDAPCFHVLEEVVELKRYRYACENSGTRWDGRRWEVHTGYSKLTDTRCYW